MALLKLLLRLRLLPLFCATGTGALVVVHVLRTALRTAAALAMRRRAPHFGGPRLGFLEFLLGFVRALDVRVHDGRAVFAHLDLARFSRQRRTPPVLRRAP